MPAFQMSFVGPYSTTAIPASYWFPSVIQFNPGQLTFQCYNSQADFQAGAQAITFHSYSFSQTQLQTFISDYTLPSLVLSEIAETSTLPVGLIGSIALAFAQSLDTFFASATPILP